MSSLWNPITLTSEAEVIRALTELRGKRWLSRGQDKPFGSLIPSIDRFPRESLSRAEKLTLERQSIDIFRSTARIFGDKDEERAVSIDDGALMVLRHYGVPTRLLDWSQSPFVSAYFAVCAHDDKDGEIWSFDYDRYLLKGSEQWRQWPQTTIGGNGTDFNLNLTAFMVEEPVDWFVCLFYLPGFHRQRAQSGLFSFTARFGRDHADSIANLLTERSYYQLYVIPGSLKSTLRTILRENHGVWRGSLYPDVAGSAETAKLVFEANASQCCQKDHNHIIK